MMAQDQQYASLVACSMIRSGNMLVHGGCGGRNQPCLGSTNFHDVTTCFCIDFLFLEYRDSGKSKPTIGSGGLILVVQY